MKKTLYGLILLSLFGAGSAHSALAIDASTKNPFASTIAPLATSAECPKTVIDIVIFNRPSYGGQALADGICYGVTASQTSTTIALLKDLEAARPDAMNYMAGAAPSPLLYSAVGKFQDFIEQETGEQMGFDEVVNQVVGSSL